MMADAPGSGDTTLPLPDQVLHKELGCSFPKICISDPRKYIVVILSPKLVAPYGGVSAT